MAISAVADELPTLLGTQTPSMFETRATRLPRRDQGPKRPLSYRLTPRDLALLDELVDANGARSRSHLITVALGAFFATKDDQPDK